MRRFEEVEVLVEDGEVGLGVARVEHWENQGNQAVHRFAAEVGGFREDQQGLVQNDHFPYLVDQVHSQVAEDLIKVNVDEETVHQVQVRDFLQFFQVTAQNGPVEDLEILHEVPTGEVELQFFRQDSDLELLQLQGLIRKRVEIHCFEGLLEDFEVGAFLEELLLNRVEKDSEDGKHPVSRHDHNALLVVASLIALVLLLGEPDVAVQGAGGSVDDGEAVEETSF